MKPRLLDLFCGAGGCSVGYHRAGFEVVGVDIKPQPHYPFEFHQADAMTYPLEGFDVIHASPPCQAYTSLRALGKGAGRNAPDLVREVRERLTATEAKWIIENVVGAPLIQPSMLCESMFSLKVRRHRLFETNWFLMTPRCAHRPGAIAVYGDHPEDAYIHSRKGMLEGSTKRAGSIAIARRAMGIEWMTWKEITQAISPSYTEWIGEQLMEYLKNQ